MTEPEEKTSLAKRVLEQTKAQASHTVFNAIATAYESGWIEPTEIDGELGWEITALGRSVFGKTGILTH